MDRKQGLLVLAVAWLTVTMSEQLGRAQGVVEPVLRIGMCDASAGAALGADRFLVANDEDNVLRIYPRGAGAEPVQAFDANAFLRIDNDHPEADIEGAAAIGQRIFWITSHGRNKDGESRPNRYRFFATQWSVEGGRVRLFFAGDPYTRLIDDLLADARLAKYGLASAAARAPKAPGALNIEGLCAGPDGASLWIGFRNPIVAGKALIVPLENPNEIIDGGMAKLGPPIEVDLGGRGIRSLDYWPERNQFLIIAGHYDEGRQFRAYLWTGRADDTPEALNVDFGQFNPEGVVLYPGETNRFQILSDDGTKSVDGAECKNAPDVRRRSFRTGWLTVP